jgi:hypothetical protein
MKKKFLKLSLLVFLYILIILPSVAQNDCSHKESVPDEMYRRRHKPAAMVYGNPYTMFEKTKVGWSIDNDL